MHVNALVALRMDACNLCHADVTAFDLSRPIISAGGL